MEKSEIAEKYKTKEKQRKGRTDQAITEQRSEGRKGTNWEEEERQRSDDKNTSKERDNKKGRKE